jgi:poly(rC)-binding protein 2/3/4
MEGLPDGPQQEGTSRSWSSAEGPEERLRLRLLVPHSLVPLLIGKKGENVKRIRRETCAAVSVAEPVLGCDERVVHFTGESLDAEDSTATADALCAVFECVCQLQQKRAESLAAAAAAPLPSRHPLSEEGSLTDVEIGSGGSLAVASGGVAGDAAVTAAAAAAGGSGMGSSCASVGGETAPGASGPSSIAGSTGSGMAPQGAAAAGAAPGSGSGGVEARLLVDSQLVGFLVGRGGGTIKDTIARSGAAVRILPKAELPACACIGDEVVRVAGGLPEVLAALRLLAGQIKAHPLRLGALSHDAAPPGSGLAAGPQLVGGLQQPPPLMLAVATNPDAAFAHPSMGGGAFMPGGAGLVAAFCGTAVEVTFRLLAPATRTGNIIGKGGEHVKRVRSETGARIKVYDPAPGSEERVVGLTSSEDALSPYCAAQDALVRCVIALTADDAPAAPHRVRLLTAQASVGIVLGKRGATVSQLRQETGASIKVLPTEPVPPAFGGSIGGDDCDTEMGSISSGMSTGGRSSLGGCEEVIQIEGSVQQCVAALRGVATLLRGWQIRRVMTTQQGALAMQQGGYAPGFAGPPPMAMAQQMPMSPTSTGRPPMSPTSPGILLPSTLLSPVQPGAYPPMGGGMLPPGMLPPSGGPQRPNCSYTYRLSNTQVGAVLGKGGSHIAQIRQLSGARVQLQDEIEGGGRALVVSGQPGQCHTAHSMANAFLSMGGCEPAFPEPMLG